MIFQCDIATLSHKLIKPKIIHGGRGTKLLYVKHENKDKKIIKLILQ